MPMLTVFDGTRTIERDVDGIVFDKDGTLIDFNRAWWGRLERSIDALRGLVTQRGLVTEAAHWEKVARADAIQAALYATLGGDRQRATITPDGPYVSTTIAETGIMAATVLYQHKVPWHRARAMVAEAMLPILTAAPDAAEIAGIGDVADLFRRLKAAGFKLAVATNDERRATEPTLGLLGIAGLVDALVCADDPGILPKPAPDGLLHIARTLGTQADRLVMVGDSAGDMATGRAAGVGLNVGVLSGPARAEHLSALADVVAADIHALLVPVRTNAE